MNQQPMHICIDGNEANVAHRVGSNVYAYELLRGIESLTRRDPNTRFTVVLSQPPLADLPTPRTGWEYQVFGPKFFWTQWALPWHLFHYRKQYDVLFTPGHYAPRWSAVPYVSSVMDLAFLHYPSYFLRKDLFQLTDWTAYSAARAQKVITISEFTRSEVILHYDRELEDVYVVYPAATPKLKIAERERMEILKKFAVQPPYILYVGTLQPRKNVIKLVEAFEYLIEQESNGKNRPRKGSSHAKQTVAGNKPITLVLAGKPGWLSDNILARIEASPQRHRIVVTGFITEQEKAALLSTSVCVCLPSLYEGFGLPPLEALVYGSIPVVAGNTSLPEVVGQAGITIDPDNRETFAKTLRYVCTLPSKEHAQLLKAGRVQLKKFSWERSSRQVLAILTSVVTGQPVDQSLWQ